MIPWNRENVYKLISLFGDNLEHPWMEVINIGTRYFVEVPINTKRHKTHQDKFEEFFKKGVTYGLIEKVDTKHNQQIRLQREWQLQPEDYNYKITRKGDALLRNELAERSGDSFYAHMYDRTIDGKFGINTFAPLQPTNINIKDKQTYKVKDLRNARRPTR
jgi:hypothetical protein